MWVDRNGRAVSPPVSTPSSFELPLDHPSLKRTASYREGKESGSFRKVILIRHPGLSLGLRIRGGVERGLGIYVCDVVQASAADYAGLRVGDQILTVNDGDFTTITRAEAADILESSPRMSMVVRSLGMMPRSPLMPVTPPEAYLHHNTDEPSPPPYYNGNLQRRTSLSRKRSTRSKKHEEYPRDHFTAMESSENVFENGYNKSKSILSSRDRAGAFESSRLERKACKHLTESQRMSLSFYCTQYDSGSMDLQAFVSFLLDLLDTPEKYSLMNEIRNSIRSEDLDHFDELIYRKEMQAMKSNDAVKHSVEIHTECADPIISPVDTMKGPSPRSSTRASGRRRPPPQQDVHLLKVPTERNQDTPSEDSGVDLPNGTAYYNLGSRKGSRVSTGSRDSILEHLQMKNTWRASNRNAPRRSLDAMRETSEATRQRRTTLRRHSSGGEGVNPEERRSSYRTFEDRRWSIGSEVPDTPAFEENLEVVNTKVLSRLEAISLSRRHSHQPPRAPRLISPVRPPLTPDGLQVPHIRVRRHRSLPDPVAIQARKRAQQMEQHQQHRTSSVRIPGHRTIPEGDGRFRVIVKKSRPLLGIAIEGGADTTQPLPRIISIHSCGAAFDSGSLRVGHIILEVDGLRTNGQSHSDVAQLIAHAFYNSDRDQIEFLVTETAKSSESEIRRASLFFE